MLWSVSPPLADLTGHNPECLCLHPELLFALRALSDSLTGMIQAQLLLA